MKTVWKKNQLIRALFFGLGSLLIVTYQNCADYNLKALDYASRNPVWAKYAKGTWSNVDVSGWSPAGIAIDSQDRIFVVGSAVNIYNVSEWTVMQSIDGGETWARVDRFSNGSVSSTNNSAHKVFIDNQDNIFVAGNAGPTYGPFEVVIRKSSDHGATWTTLDDYIHGTDNMNFTAAAIDQDGNILYTCEYAVSGGSGLPSVMHTVLRRISANGTKTLLSDTTGATGTNVATRALGSPSSNTFWMFNGISSSSSTNGEIKSTTDQGTNWTTLASDSGINWSDFVIRPGFSPYSIGFSTGVGAVLRRFNGSSFVDTIDHGSACRSSIAVTKQNYVFAGSSCYSQADKQFHWIVRAEPLWGINWIAFDDLPAGGYGPLWGIAVDSKGALFTVGQIQDGQGVGHGIIRRYIPGQ